MPSSGRSPWLARAARVAAIIWTVVVLVTHSDAGVSFPMWMAIYGAAVVVFLWWVIGVSVACAIAMKEGTGVARAFRAWSAVPALMLAAELLVWSNLPLETRLFLSGPALAQSADWFRSLPEDYARETRPWIGLFRVREFSQFGDELRFLTTECGLVDNCGLVFSPSGPPPNRGEDSFEHLYGPWYHWHQSW
ncbi:MAG TPA: hypothetical protein VH740_02945 [Vicinamibacterales bacterium]|jgi:hypothetical protein